MLSNRIDVLQLTNNKTIMKKNLIKPYCYYDELENSLVDNAIFVYFSNEYRRVLPDEILWMKVSGSCCVVYMENGTETTVNCPLDRVFNNDLPCSKFKGIHWLHAVNLFKVTGFAGNYIHIGRKMLPVGESHKKDFQACFRKIHLKWALGRWRKGVGRNPAPPKIENSLRKECVLPLHRKFTKERKQLGDKFKNSYYGS